MPWWLWLAGDGRCARGQPSGRQLAAGVCGVRAGGGGAGGHHRAAEAHLPTRGRLGARHAQGGARDRREIRRQYQGTPHLSQHPPEWHGRLYKPCSYTCTSVPQPLADTELLCVLCVYSRCSASTCTERCSTRVWMWDSSSASAGSSTGRSCKVSPGKGTPHKHIHRHRGWCAGTATCQTVGLEPVWPFKHG